MASEDGHFSRMSELEIILAARRAEGQRREAAYHASLSGSRLQPKTHPLIRLARALSRSLALWCLGTFALMGWAASFFIE